MFALPAVVFPAQAVIVLAAVAEWVAPLGVSSGWAQSLGEQVAGTLVYADTSTARNVVNVTATLRAFGVEEDSGLLTEAAVRRLVDPIEAQIAELPEVERFACPYLVVR